MKNFFSRLTFCILLLSTPALAADLPYVSGGISEEGRAELNQTSQNYNLKLIFALASGAYLSEIKVGIKDARGDTVIDAISIGPWFFAHLPPGKYTVTVSNKDQSLRKSARVKSSGQTKLSFYWKDE